jgi:hypothetical protein
MMRADLKAARQKWIQEVKTPKERKEREKSDFLQYQNDAGLFADFHSNRHTFITNLERAGVSPRTAQTLARHCDIRLTMGVYTHIGLHDQTTAIERLPSPPELAAREPCATSPAANGKVAALAKTKLSNGELAVPRNGSDQHSALVAEVGPLDTLWRTLPDDVKAGIFALITAAAKPGESSVVSGQDRAQMVS